MIYLKSLLAGLAGMTLTAILFPLVWATISLFLKVSTSGANGGTWDLRSALGSAFFRWFYALALVFFFVIAFLWEFRRVPR
jgi:hypothetical protein